MLLHTHSVRLAWTSALLMVVLGSYIIGWMWLRSWSPVRSMRLDIERPVTFSVIFGELWIDRHLNLTRAMPPTKRIIWVDDYSANAIRHSATAPGLFANAGLYRIKLWWLALSFGMLWLFLCVYSPKLKERRRTRRNLCVQCGYPKAHLSSSRCPECGMDFCPVVQGRKRGARRVTMALLAGVLACAVGYGSVALWRWSTPIGPLYHHAIENPNFAPPMLPSFLDRGSQWTSPDPAAERRWLDDKPMNWRPAEIRSGENVIGGSTDDLNHKLDNKEPEPTSDPPKE